MDSVGVSGEEGRDSVQCGVCEWLQVRHYVLPAAVISVIICV